MTGDPERRTKMARDDAITGVRALAITLVLGSHLAIAQALPWPWVIKGSGQLGVMLFFLLSGFLMARLYGRSEADWPSRRYFLAARFGRVAPAYFVIVLISIAATQWIPGWPYRLDSWSDIVRHLFFIEGTNALWAVPVEVQFYLVFFALWVLSPARWFGGFVLMAIPLSWVVAVWSPLPGEDIRPLQAYVPYFFAGCAMGLLLPEDRPRLPIWLGWPLSLVALLALLGAFPFLRRHFGFELPIWQDPIVFVSLIFVFVSALWRVGAFELLTWRPCLWLGTISYGVYLLNPIILHLVNRYAELGPIGEPVCMIALTMVAATLSWYALERPALGWFRRLGSPAATG